ncbi:hypothetical protein ES332_A03G065600v1 [Gossypium tomentosum]|uniref:DUF674 domain-containing protein n=1 Tax=Gossypium tomentosum TaxID=34277 RepID=A0A5D2R6B5_GOSTO|nr:hypothetical protein ES332_A03G065600v1 [Gossypium tomentosum]
MHFSIRKTRPEPELPTMDDDTVICLKVVVDKTKDRVVFVESDDKFVDILFSFLTMPMGTIVRLTRNRRPTTNIGCMNNLYNSVEILDALYLRTKACKTMLLYPASLRYFLCSRTGCRNSGYKLLSHYPDAICWCGERMYSADLVENKTRRVSSDDKDRGVFVKGPIRLMISDELRIMPPSTAASFSLFSELGIEDMSVVDDRTFSMGKLEALNLLKCLLVSKTPLTEALLDHIPVLSLNDTEDLERVSIGRLKGEASNEDGKMYVKLIVSKSKNRVMVCYCEASENFVDLLFSFLTVPLGFIVKEMQKGSSTGCINHLYDSIQDLDARNYLVSKETTAMLTSPKLAPGFRYEGQALDIEEYMHQPYYLTRSQNILMPTSDETLIPPGETVYSSALTVMDPKSHHNDNSSSTGFIKGPAMFTVTDDLIISPLSSVTGLSAVRKLKIPFTDIEERVVYVGKEASCLMRWSKDLNQVQFQSRIIHGYNVCCQFMLYCDLNAYRGFFYQNNIKKFIYMVVDYL